ncbi:MAG: hypothetical protein IIB66_10260, partial [Proteobacteria bacterium]|nr:hypothetical protein [Pseudomonadota bacterium]
MRHLVDEGVLTRENAQEILSRASEDCLEWGPNLQRYKEASYLTDLIRDEDFPAATH